MNIAPDELASLLVGLGEATPDIRQIVQHAHDCRWAIVLDDGVVVTAELLGDVGRLCLCAELGRPHEQDRMALWEAMLLYSSLRASTGGMSLALAAPDGECQLLCDATIDSANPAVLRDVFIRFVEDARRWRAAVTRGPQCPADSGCTAREAALAGSFLAGAANSDRVSPTVQPYA